MDVVHSCRCCLRRAPDKHLMTPYTHLGTTEIYSDMLKECFEIHLLFDSEEEVGICDVCVGRLRDASDFKLQVQHSLVELQAWLQESQQIKEESCAVESIKEDGDGTSEEPVLCEDALINLEMKNEDNISDKDRQERLEDESAVGAGMVHLMTRDRISYEERAVKAEVSDDASSDEDCIPHSVLYTVSNRGALQLILNRFMYYCHYQRDNGRKRRWRCIDYRDAHCPVAINTVGEQIVERYLIKYDKP